MMKTFVAIAAWGMLAASVAESSLPPATQPAICAAACDGDLQTVKTLLRDHPNMVASVDDIYGWTPLQVAVKWNQKDVVELLLANKADVNAKTNDGQTPLHVAVKWGHKDLAELLRHSGARE